MLAALSCGAPRLGDAGTAGNGDSGAQDAGPVFAVCVPGLAPTLSDIQARVFVPSCGASRSSELGFCHSAGGSSLSGGLDLQTNPYLALLGPDGGGAPAQNVAGTASGLLRVDPGRPETSFLLLKLQDSSPKDSRYGRGMPYFAPASVCPETFATIAAWVSAGGPNN